MGLQIKYDLKGVQLSSAYLMVGDVILHRKDKTAEIFVYLYASKDEREGQQRLLGTPIRKFVERNLYSEFFEQLVTDATLMVDPDELIGMSVDGLLAWAAYRLLAKYPEPVGMREWFETGTEA